MRSMTDKAQSIKGELTRVVFSNESGFLIGSFRTDDGKIFTAKGCLLNPQVNLEYKLMGEWEASPKYGQQFSFAMFETVIPDDLNGIFKYLVRVCKYVGSATGQALVDKYGADTLKIMKESPARVAADIHGITIERAKEIQEKLIENQKSEKVLIALEGMFNIEGMLKALPGRVYARYKSNAAEKVKENPYILTGFPMVGFNLADRVALHIGFSRTSIERKKAAAIHCLKEHISTGSVWIHKSELLAGMNSLIQLTGLEDGIQVLINDGIIVEEEYEYIAFSGLAIEERQIASRAIMLFSMPLPECKHEKEEIAA